MTEPTSTRPPVVVAMSGGVDSSVAAALLTEQGYPVLGIMLRLWSEAGQEAYNRCCAPEAVALARRVAEHLEIPFYVVDIKERFRQHVVAYFIEGYSQGITPNPCFACNRLIRWGALLDYATAMGARYLATGHYARLRRRGGRVELLRARDRNKDQSYVLSALSQEQLQKTIFPLGDMTKNEVRRLAADHHLPVATRPDSQDLCFITDGDYRAFLRRHAPAVERPGPILDHQGQVLGQHGGLAFYTIGQRKGLGVSAPQPLYVLEKDRETNSLIVGPRSQLGSASLTAAEVNWIAGSPPTEPFRASVKIRYRAPVATALVTPLNGDRAQVVFDQPLADITPGQRAVFYDGDLCLGGGVISPPEGNLEVDP